MKALIPFLSIVSLATAQPPITRDGSDWLQIQTGTIPLDPTGRVHISTEGSVVLRGLEGNGPVTYTLKTRVRSSSHTDAEVSMRDFQLRMKVFGTMLALELATPRRVMHSAELSIVVPNSLREAIVTTLGGNVTASDLACHLQVETAAGRIELERLGAGVSLKTGGGEVRIGRVAGGVRCFSGGGNIRVDSVGRESWFETAGGDIVIHNSEGTVHASTGGGNVQVDRSAGEVYAHTAGGVIEVREAAGLVTADNSGGAIQVSASKGVRCESSAGAIRLKNIGGGSVRATTAMGNILAELLSATRIEDSLLSTSSGDITVFLPSNTPVTVEARNESTGGRGIVSDFPQIRVRPAGMNSGLAVLAQGALNGGGPILRIYVSGGTIYLRRQK